jgi:predicted ATPase
MKIDLHCHTRAVRRGELATRNVTKEMFASKIVEANVKIVAITNHDIFDRSQFDEFQLEVGSSCGLWPGIELNIDHDGEKYHLIVITSPDSIDEFEEAVTLLTLGKVADFDLELSSVITAFEGIETVYIPHFGNKTPGITQAKLIDLHDKMTRANRVILEDSNSRSTAILSSHGMRTITGSDIKDWNIYQSVDVSELRIPVDTFEQFCLFLDRDPTVIKTLLDKNPSTRYIGRPSKENHSITIEVPIYNEVNIIFGDKGTGKSQILESIGKKMDADGLSVAPYISSKKDEDIKGLIDSTDMERSAAKLDLDECEEDYEFVRNWGDESIESLQTFIRYGKTKHLAASKERIKFTEQQVLPYDEDLLEAVETDLEYTNDAIEKIEEIEGEYLSEEKMTTIRDSLNELEQSIEAKKLEEVIEKYTCRLIIFTTRRVRSIVASNSGTVAKPTSTGYYEYAKNRIALHDAMSSILKNLALPKSHKERVPLGNIGEKGELFVESRWKLLDSDPGQREYSGNPNITSLRNSLSNMKNVLKYSFSDDPQNYLDKFNTYYDEREIISNGVFVGTCKYIVDNDLNEYEPSNGEKAIVLIQRVLNEDKDVYLLDEPELSLGGTYIDKEIRPQITKLGKAGKIVFIATHNANIAVRTLPYNTIYRYHDKSGYKTYLGNPFTNKLVDVTDPSNYLDWKETSMKVLEGGEDAFNDRGIIYEAGKVGL